MFLSTFEVFKIGIGPSSSHTVGPMIAAGRFLETLAGRPGHRIRVSLHGSLAFTGKGHATDRAIVLGLAGENPKSIETDRVEDVLSTMADRKRAGVYHFDPDRDIIFDFGPPLNGHPNGMICRLEDEHGQTLLSETYYSIGGGFIQTEAERTVQQHTVPRDVPFPFANSAEMLAMGEASGLSIAEMKRANEKSSALDADLDTIWQVMDQCLERGLSRHGLLPGSLKVKRRAADLLAKLRAEATHNALQPHRAMEFLSAYAIAVNEENAAGGRVVTAPTNGAAGVIPAVIRYYRDHCSGSTHEGIRTFLLTAAAVGGIIKYNASISGAEVGCQGEIGSASAMAAAGLCAALGGSNTQIENAAEIALEHHLGMTCDPVGGLVLVPCIERNAFGAVKAVAAASLALRGDGQHVVSLDTCIETMRQTGLDMNHRYKETSQGGLAVNVVEC